MFINVGSIFYPAFSSTNGIAIEIYLAGCARKEKCKGCHNPELWDFSAGMSMEISEIVSLIREKFAVDSIAIMGGEPLHNPALFSLLKALKSLNKTIWLYTSYELEDVPNFIKNLCDFIKTGTYEEKLRTKDEWLASANQKIYKKVGDIFELYYDNGKILFEYCINTK